MKKISQMFKNTFFLFKEINSAASKSKNHIEQLYC